MEYGTLIRVQGRPPLQASVSSVNTLIMSCYMFCSSDSIVNRGRQPDGEARGVQRAVQPAGVQGLLYHAGRHSGRAVQSRWSFGATGHLLLDALRSCDCEMTPSFV